MPPDMQTADDLAGEEGQIAHPAREEKDQPARAVLNAREEKDQPAYAVPNERERSSATPTDESGGYFHVTGKDQPRLWALIPGDLDSPTGGYRYDRRILAGLTDLGWRVRHCPLDASFPLPTPAALAEAGRVLAAIPDEELVLVDGLAYGALPDLAEAEGRRLRLVALVHHPLALETGLSTELASALRESEIHALAQARLILVTSRFTARLLTEAGGWGVTPDRVRVVEPGMEPVAALGGARAIDLHEGQVQDQNQNQDQLEAQTQAQVYAHGQAQDVERAASVAPAQSPDLAIAPVLAITPEPKPAVSPDLLLALGQAASPESATWLGRPACAGGPPAPRPLRLLCVASLTPRKGHDLLLRALAGLRDYAWHLDCIGSHDLDPAWAKSLLGWREEWGLGGRVTFRGPLPAEDLGRHYAAADLFVLPSRFEGYGMVCAEALAHGLPILATRAGALEDTVPAEAGLLVPPEDARALAGALRRLFADPALRQRLTRGAWAAGLRLPTWEQSSAAFAAALLEVGREEAAGDG